MQHELLVVYVNQLLEKEDSGIKVLFRDDKVYFSQPCLFARNGYSSGCLFRHCADQKLFGLLCAL